MPPLANQTIQLRFKPGHRWYLLGSGWAIVAGLLSTRYFSLTLENLIYISLLWFLIDPLLGSLKDLWIQRDRWCDANNTQPFRLWWYRLPYLAKNSPAASLNNSLLALLNAPNGEGYTLILGAFLALGLSLLLGPLVVGVTVLSLMLALLLGSYRPPLLLQTIIDFLIPFMLGHLIFSPLNPVVILIALIFSCIFYGLLQLNQGQLFGAYLVRGGLVAAVCVVFCLYRPVLGLAIALVALFCHLLYLYLPDFDDNQAASRTYLNQTGLFVLVALFIGTIALR